MDAKEKSFLSDILQVLNDLENFKGTHPILESVPKNIPSVSYPGKDHIIKNQTSRFSKE